jgi:phosphoribosylformylglycinamidine synthase
MAEVKTLMLRAPGTNCDVESAFAFEKAGAQVELVHVTELIRRWLSDNRHSWWLHVRG